MDRAQLPTHSVVIVTYERPDYLRRCLQGLQKEYASLRQIVVVDASRCSQAREFLSDPMINYVHDPELAGHMTTSRNHGLLHVSGDVISFLDDDVVVHPGWSIAVRRAFQETGAAAVAGRTLNGEPGEEVAAGKIGDLTPDGELTSNFAASTTGRVAVSHGIGANMSFTREILRELGGFRDDYPGTALREDTDIYLRIGRLGGRIVYDPDAAVDHLPAPHVHGNRFDTRYKLYGRRNHVVLLSRHDGMLSPMVRRWLKGQVRAVGAPSGTRRKLERLGVTLLGAGWGLAVAPKYSRFRPLDPRRRDGVGQLIRASLSRASGDR